MSDNILTLIPVSPEYVPVESARAAADELLRSMVLAADEVSSEVSDQVQFFDAGSNFESVSCPVCHAELSTDWWGEAMDSAFQHQPPRLEVVLPCCATTTSLNDLAYSWPQGFARYSLAARNPNIRELSPAQTAHLATVIGAEIRPIWSHI